MMIFDCAPPSSNPNSFNDDFPDGLIALELTLTSDQMDFAGHDDLHYCMVVLFTDIATFGSRRVA